MNDKDKAVDERNMILNKCESMAYNAQQLLDNEYKNYSSEEEKVLLRGKCQEVITWFYDEGNSTTAKTEDFQKKINEMEEKSKPIRDKINQKDSLYQNLGRMKENALILSANMSEEKFNHILEEEKDQIRKEVELKVSQCDQILTSLNNHNYTISLFSEELFKTVSQD
jgi:hypothetical protein